jgi:hypothetical protein
MTTITLSDIERALRSGWGADTCAPEDVSSRHPDSPARGQCGVTALVVNDLLGGDLVYGEVRVDGQVTDHHWWNRFGDLEIDLTREHSSVRARRSGPARPWNGRRVPPLAAASSTSCCGAGSSSTSALPTAGVRPSSRSPRGRSSRARSASGCAW